MATPNSNTNTAKQKQPKRITYATPKGRGLFFHVTEPDYGTDKFPLKDGQYSLSLILDSDSTGILKERLADELRKAEDYADEQFAGLKRVTREKLGSVTFNQVCEPVYDEDDEPTGEYRWRFKTSAFAEDKATGKKRKRTIPVFDSMNQAVHLKEEPGNGTTVRVSFTCAPYFVEGQGMGGLSLYLNAVQILKLVRFGERDATSYGFTAEEDGEGFTASEVVDEEGSTSRRSGEAVHGDEDRNDNIPEDMPF